MWSQRSRANRESLQSDLVDLFDAVEKEFPCEILEGHRGEGEQNEAFAAGRSRLQWPQSKHNTYPSEAADVAPLPIDWNNLSAFYFFAGYVLGVASEMGISIRWGGDWDSDKDLRDQSFNDLVHFELLDRRRVKYHVTKHGAVENSKRTIWQKLMGLRGG